MSRFADPTATRTVPLGPCQCPGAPHEQDEVTLRWQLGASALARIGRAELQGAVAMDPMAAYRQTAIESVVSWNLLWFDPNDHRNGSRAPVPAPVTASAIAELDVDTLKVIAETADKLITGEGSLPNGSGAPSAASLPGSASPAPKRTRKRGT